MTKLLAAMGSSYAYPRDSTKNTHPIHEKDRLIRNPSTFASETAYMSS